MTEEPTVLIIADDPFWLEEANELAHTYRDEIHCVIATTISRLGVNYRTRGVLELDLDWYRKTKQNVTGIRLRGTALRDFDCIFSLHCQKRLPKILLDAVPCVNLHPGYLPKGRGWRPAAFAIACDEQAGATIHWMTEEIDKGPIIDRLPLSCPPWATVKEVYDRVRQHELSLLWTWYDKLSHGQVDRSECIPINEDWPIRTKSDYGDLCYLGRLNGKEASWRPFLKRLAALTYGEQHNAYFTDQDGRVVRVGITLTAENAEIPDQK